jgi:hypothetical protein
VEGAPSPADGNLPEPKTENGRQRRAMLEKMKGIILPEVDFRQANIHDVIQFLQQTGVQHDPEHQGINLVLNLQPFSHVAQDSGDPFAAQGSGDPFAARIPDDPSNGVPLITFSARDISLLETLQIVTSVANLRWRLKESVVMVVPVWDCVDIIHHAYNLLPSTIKRIQEYQPSVITTNTPPIDADSNWKSIFADLGMSWPVGSSIRFLPPVGMLVVANSPENLAFLDSIITAINTYPLRPGRFLLTPVNATKGDAGLLLMLDTETGNMWRYRGPAGTEDSDGERVDYFQILAVSAFAGSTD